MEHVLPVILVLPTIRFSNARYATRNLKPIQSTAEEQGTCGTVIIVTNVIRAADQIKNVTAAQNY